MVLVLLEVAGRADKDGRQEEMVIYVILDFRSIQEKFLQNKPIPNVWAYRAIIQVYLHALKRPFEPQDSTFFLQCSELVVF